MIRRVHSTAYLIGAALVAMALVFLFFARRLPPQVPLFYSRPEGDSQIADLPVIITIPILTVVIVVLNQAIKNRFFPHSLFVQKCIQYVNVGVVLSFTLIFLKLLLLVS